jgi:hypothetical protein
MVSLLAIAGALVLVSAPPAAERLKIRPNAAFNSERFECPATAARVSAIIGHRMIQQSGKLYCDFAERLVGGVVKGIYVLFRSSGGDSTSLLNVRAEFVKLNRGSGCPPIADYPDLGRHAFVSRCRVSWNSYEIVIFRSPNHLHTWKVIVNWLLPRENPRLSVVDHQLRSLISG